MAFSAEVFAKRPRRALAIIAALSLVALLGWLGVRVPDYRNAPGGFSEILKAESGAGRPDHWSECLLVIDTDGDGSLFQKRHLIDLRTILKGVRALPDVEKATALDEVPIFNAAGLPRPLLPPPDADEAAIMSAREAATTHPIVNGQLLSPDTTTTAVPLALRQRDDIDKTIIGLSEAIDGIAAHTGLRARLTGAFPIQTAIHTTSMREQFRFLAIGYSLVIIIALVIFRGIRASLVAALPAFFAVFWALGILFFLRQGISPLSQVITPVMLTMIAFTDSVHLLFQYRVIRAHGTSQREACVSALRQLTVPCALTSLTTAIGFGSLMIAHSRIVRDFGLACALGVVLTFVAVITLSPLLQISRLGRDVHRGVRPEVEDDMPAPPNAFVSGLMRHARLIVLGAILLVALSGWLASALRPDHRILTDIPERSDAYQALALCDEKLGGVQFAQIRVRAPPDATSAQSLAVLAEAQAVFESEPLVAHPFSLRDLLQSLPGAEGNLEMRIPLLAFVPDDLVRMLHDEEERTFTVFGRVRDIGIARYRTSFGRIEGKLADLESQHPGCELELAGSPIWWGRYLHRMVMDLVRSLALASVLIFFVMGLVHRSVRIGFISVLPNIIPLAITASLLALGGWGLEIVTVCAFTICLGIAVDDTVHFLWRYGSDLKRSGDRAASINSAFVHTGRVMVATTAVMVGGFATPLISDIAGFRAFGALACGTLAAALLADLVVLPALLWLVPGRIKS